MLLLTNTNTSSSSWFKTTLFLLAIISVSHLTMATMINYEGTYRLTGLSNSDQPGPIDIPSSGDLLIKISKVVDSSSSTNNNNNNNEYQVGIKIGNNMGTRMTVTSSSSPDDNNDIVTFGRIISTRMMPAPALWKIEVGINKVLGVSPYNNSNNDDVVTTSIRLVPDNNQQQQILLIENTVGRIECTRSSNSNSVLEAGV